MEVSKFIMMSTDEFIDFTVKRSNQNLILKLNQILYSEDNLVIKLIKEWLVLNLVLIIMKLIMLN